MSNIIVRASMCAAGLSIAALTLAPVTADAQKMTREQAWGACLTAVAKYRDPSPENDAAKVAAFKACMAKLGFKP